MPDAGGPLRLDGEQRNEDRDRHGHHIGAETRGRDAQAFERQSTEIAGVMAPSP